MSRNSDTVVGGQVNRYSLDPATPSGRDVWWAVIEGLTIGKMPYVVTPAGLVSLEDYIVARAERGCPDCISAILECQRDELLLEALTYDICSPEIEVLVAELSHEAEGR